MPPKKYIDNFLNLTKIDCEKDTTSREKYQKFALSRVNEPVFYGIEECRDRSIEKDIEHVCDSPPDLNPNLSECINKVGINSIIKRLQSQQYLKVSNLICAFVKNTVNITDGCSPIGDKISNNLIRVASTRIFADPFQSLL